MILSASASRRRFWAPLYLGLLACIALAGTFGASERAAAAPAPKRLLVLGDSVLAGVPAAGELPALQQALPAWQVTFDAEECRSISGTRRACGGETGTVDGGLQALQAHGTGFDAVVVLLGTNDAADPAAAQSTIADAKLLLAVLHDVPHVYWLTIREAGHYAAGYAAFNQLLRQLPASYPNLTVVDWAAATKDHPELFAADGLHLDDAGARYAATVIAAAVEDKLPATVPTIVPSSATSAATGPSTSAATTTTGAPATSASAARSSNDTGTSILIGVVVVLVLIGGIVVAVLAGRRRERRNRKEERSARVEAELARSAAALKEQRAQPEAPEAVEPVEEPELQPSEDAERPEDSEPLDG